MLKERKGVAWAVTADPDYLFIETVQWPLHRSISVQEQHQRIAQRSHGRDMVKTVADNFGIAVTTGMRDMICALSHTNATRQFRAIV